MTEPDDLAARAAELVGAFDAVDASIGELGRRVDKHQYLIKKTIERQSAQIARTRRFLAWTAVSVVLDIALSVWCGAMYVQQRRVTENVQAIEARTSCSILLPLFEVFDESLRLNPSPPGATPDQVKLRAEAATAIQVGLQDLGCGRVDLPGGAAPSPATGSGTK